MTSAARPTWNPARGSSSQGGSRLHAPSQQFSAKDQPGYTQLKMRRPGQGTTEELKQKDFKEVLEEKERKHFVASGRDVGGGVKREEEEEEERLMLEAPKEKRDTSNIDADDTDSSESEENSSSDSEEDDDDTAELMRELEKIKKERAEEERKRQEEQERQEEQDKDNAIRFGNPLLNAGEANFNVKKRWYDDVVFKNQAKDEPQKKKRFINDTIRNDFHRKFLSKYIQ